MTEGHDATSPYSQEQKKTGRGVPGIDGAQYGVFGNLKFLVPSRSTMLQEPEEFADALERYLKTPTRRTGTCVAIMSGKRGKRSLPS